MRLPSSSDVAVMPIDHPEQELPSSSAEPPFDPMRERARILAELRGRKLTDHQAEFICATLALLAEMEEEH